MTEKVNKTDAVPSEYTEEICISDRLLKSGKPLSPRHKEMARLIFLGKGNAEIAETLNYTPTRVSALRSTPQIMAEVERYQDAAFERTVSEKLTKLAPLAANVLEEILMADDPSVKASVKKEAAVWVLEKTTGRPKPESETDGGVTILHLLQALDRRKDQKEPQSETAPAQTNGLPVEEDWMEKWVRENCGQDK